MEKVYYSFVDLNVENLDYGLFDTERKKYIQTLTDNKHKAQSIYVWKLLLYALGQFNENVTKDYVFCNDNGRFYLKDQTLNFSLSHSNNLVAVIVSDFSCGIDVEKLDAKILKIKKRIIKDIQQEKTFLSLFETEQIKFLTEKWTEKEAKFKADSDLSVSFKTLSDKDGNEYVLAYTSKVLPKKIDLDKIL